MENERTSVRRAKPGLFNTAESGRRVALRAVFEVAIFQFEDDVATGAG